VRLNRIALANFRQHADTRIDFDAGLTGIIGPNGSGKTTILEALAWAIYGNTAARGTRESIRFNRAAPRATVRVELDFEMAGHRYRVVRGLTNAELYLDGAATPIANSISGVTEILTRKLGMTRDEFFNTYFTGQKDLSVMAAMKPTERGQFLSHVLGYERLRDAQKLARLHLTELRSQITGIQQGMPDAEQVAKQLDDARRRLASTLRAAQAAREVRTRAQAAFERVRPRWELVQRERDALQALLAELRGAEGEEAGLARDAERLARELGGIASAKAEREALAVFQEAQLGRDTVQHAAASGDAVRRRGGGGDPQPVADRQGPAGARPRRFSNRLSGDRRHRAGGGVAFPRAATRCGCRGFRTRTGELKSNFST